MLYGSVWVQFGVISALRVNATSLVDTNSIAVYTNVKFFTNWINEIVSKSVDVVVAMNDAVTEMDDVVMKEINLYGYGDFTSYFGYVVSE